MYLLVEEKIPNYLIAVSGLLFNFASASLDFNLISVFPTEMVLAFKA